MKAKNNSEETEYKVRIFYDPKDTQIDQKKLTESMWYKQDSSFYRLEGTNKKYADAIIPVPNGLKNCFEYIVIFNNTKEELGNNLTYKDKYITGKAYQLSLK